METYITYMIEFPMYYTKEERISSKKFSPLFLNNFKHRSLLNNLPIFHLFMKFRLIGTYLFN